ncbi:MAG TPA: hypothetical protein VLE22_15995 [Bryobacteraceae bacterium]|nr:hypothetical protein [Bryobacteraceae bacterium]
MTSRFAAIAFVFAAVAPVCPSQEVAPPRPRAGKVEILKSAALKPGMKGVAWTVFQGSEPEPVPVEIIGLWKNAWGPRQDVILAKLGGKVQRTNVAGGMSGSPVYIDGKLIGAIALRLSVFSPDAICGITPIELMLEISDFDSTVPSGARTPDKAVVRDPLAVPGEVLAQAVAAGASPGLLQQSPLMVPIETPLSFSGFHENVLREFGPLFQQLGLTAVQGGASGSLGGPKPAPGWQNALQPGDPVAGVLVSGDMTISGLGTVTYNDGKRVLAFGHPFFNLGPVEMPLSKGEVLMVLSSSFQPNKIANATEVVGSLKQDRHSGILGVLGETADMIPVSVKVRSFAGDNSVLKEKAFRYNVFVQQRWTPNLMMITLFNSISGVNDFSDENTYRLSGKVELDGGQSLSLETMQAPSEVPIPAPILLAGWVGDKFNRLFLNAVKAPRLKRVDVNVDLLPQRRIAAIESAWAGLSEVDAGGEVPVKVFLRPYRGERIERAFNLKIPAGLPKGEHGILLSDAETLNRLKGAVGRANRFIDLAQTVSLINQERTNNQLYVSLVQASPTVYYDDKTLPSLPASVLNVMQAGNAANRPFITSRETVLEQTAIPFDYVIDGSYALKIKVK